MTFAKNKLISLTVPWEDHKLLSGFLDQTWGNFVRIYWGFKASLQKSFWLQGLFSWEVYPIRPSG